jgi:D-glycero-D-manno-heptose 1,7-bisphosphate phosphatase
VTRAPAIFLDRDGTLNRDAGYVHRLEDLALLDGVSSSLARLKRAGFLLIVVSNQSGVARGLYSEADVQRFHAQLNLQLMAADAGIDAFYYCPFHPEATLAQYRAASPLRKPELGMFELACRDFAIDVPRSFMIGDKPSDVEFGLRAGLGTFLIAAPGAAPQLPTELASQRVASLAEAVEHILKRPAAR